MVMSATNTNEPTFRANGSKRGRTGSIVNSDEIIKRIELDEVTLKRADLIIINSRQQAEYAGQSDLLDPIARGEFTWDKVHELGKLLVGDVRGRTNDKQITLYKNNVGMGVQFAAVGAKVCEIAKKQGLGRKCRRIGSGKHPSVEEFLREPILNCEALNGCPITLFLGFVPDQLLAQSKMKVAYSSITGNQAPLWVAQDRGIFKRNGLEVELIFIEGEAGLFRRCSPETPLAHAEQHRSSRNLSGADLMMVVATVNKILLRFYCARHFSAGRPQREKSRYQPFRERFGFCFARCFERARPGTE
jgi:hypothetical protein